MKKKPNNIDPDSAADELFEEQVFRGLLAEGYVAPVTPAEVRLAGAQSHAGTPPLPDDLRDPRTVLREIKQRLRTENSGSAVPFPLPAAAGMEEEVRRVARHGRPLSAKIRAKMGANRARVDGELPAEGGEIK